MDEVKKMLDWMREEMANSPDVEGEFLGNCDWCSAPVYSDQPHEAGNGGEGVMHSDCGEDAAQYGGVV